MRYRNTETGAFFESDVKISGNGWIEDPVQPQISASEVKKKPVKKRTTPRKTQSG